MKAQSLRNAANQLNLAAQQVESNKAGHFNWAALIQILTQLLPEIVALFQAPSPPDPAPLTPPPPAPHQQGPHDPATHEPNPLAVPGAATHAAAAKPVTPHAAGKPK
jgi:hypothetical protein